MQALRFVFLMAMSLIHIVPFAVIGALIAEHFITHPKVDTAFDGYPHVGTIVFALLVSIAACAAVVSDKDEEGTGLIHVYWITAQTAAAWPMFRLALVQPTMVAGLPFYVLALLLFLSGAVNLISISASKRPHFGVPAIALAVTIVVFGVFLRGERSLALSRDEGQVNGAYVVTRWCGLTQPVDMELLGIIQYEWSYQSDHFRDFQGEGVVISTTNDQHLLILDSRMYWNGLAGQVREQLEGFLQSDAESLLLTERTPVVPLVVFVGVAAAVVYLGTPARHHTAGSRWHRRVLRKAAGWTAAAVAGGAFFMTAQFVISQLSADRVAFQGLAEVADVEVCDLVIRSKTINTNAWRVSIDDANFGDADLQRIVPYLMEAPVLWLDLSHTQVTDAGIRALRPVVFVPVLKLQNTRITAACLPDICGLAVRHLDVRNTQIAGADLNKDLLYMIESLWITDQRMTVKEMPVLFGLRDLEYVSIGSTQLTQEDLEFWRVELEDLVVEIEHVDAEITADDFDF